MIVLRPFTNSVPLSLNQYNTYNNIGDLNGLDITKWHYIFRITNELTEYQITFQPTISGSYSLGGDLYWNTDLSPRMNEFRWYVSPTQSNPLNGVLLFTQSNWDNAQWNYECWSVWGLGLTSGTPSVSNVGTTQSYLLESGKLYFTIE